MDLYPIGGVSKGISYRHYTGKPTVAFGSGLSYTSFSYSNLRLNSSVVGPCGRVCVRVDVHNDGEIDSDEVTQLYAATPNASVPAPTLRLADFQRVHIPAGETKTVSLVLDPRSHSVVMENVPGWSSKFWQPTVVVEAGEVLLHVGGGQPGVTPGVLGGSVRVTTRGTIAACPV
jgi:beta-glucosidase